MNDFWDGLVDGAFFLAYLLVWLVKQGYLFVLSIPTLIESVSTGYWFGLFFGLIFFLIFYSEAKSKFNE